MNTTSINANIVKVEELTLRQKDAMFALMEEHFEGVDRQLFENDLMEKGWAVILAGSSENNISGFSTVMILEDIVENIQIKAIYSGDTIVSKSCRNLFSLERCWIPFVFSCVKAQPTYKWYWFLICKGYRTYRYLPIYFHRYLPSKDYMATAFESTALNNLARNKFGNAYDAQKGIIKSLRDYRLKPGVGDITEREISDPYISFFLKKNPEWHKGTELACLTELSFDNLNPILIRLLKRKGIEPL